MLDSDSGGVQATMREVIDQAAKLVGIRTLTDHVGGNDKTVAAWRTKFEVTSEIPKSRNRAGKDK